jgi:Cu/Ag efflux pump CusA
MDKKYVSGYVDDESGQFHIAIYLPDEVEKRITELEEMLMYLKDKPVIRLSDWANVEALLNKGERYEKD